MAEIRRGGPNAGGGLAEQLTRVGGFLNNNNSRVALKTYLRSKPMLKPIGLIEGHYECRSLTKRCRFLPICWLWKLSNAKTNRRSLNIPTRSGAWLCTKEGPNAANKPHTNHYGFRVGEL